MAIIPQISVVKPDQEVLRYTGTTVDDIRNAVQENSSGGVVQITIQQGTFTGSSPVEIPVNVYVVIMPGAKFQEDVTDLFVDATNPTSPSPNVADFNSLRTGGSGNVVFTVETDDTLEQNTTSGNIDLSVKLSTDKNSLLLDSKTSGDFDRLTVNPQNVVARTDSDLTTIPMNNNSVLSKATGNIESTQFSSNSILARFGTDNLSNVQIRDNSILAKIPGNRFEDSVLSENTLLARLPGSDLDQVDLDDQSLIDAFKLQASDIASGEFKDAGSGISYEFNSNVNVDFNLTVSNKTFTDVIESTGENDINVLSGESVIIQGGRDSFTTTNGTIFLEGQVGEGPIFEVGREEIFGYQNWVEIRGYDQFRIITEDPTEISEGGVGQDMFVIHKEGYIDLPIKDTVPRNPPEGYIRFYARSDNLGNPTYDDGRVIFVTSGGERTEVDPS